MNSMETVFGAAFAALPADNLLAVDPEDVKAGWLGLIIVAAMGVALYFILRSFVKHLKRVDFDEGPKIRRDRPREGDQGR